LLISTLPVWHGHACSFPRLESCPRDPSLRSWSVAYVGHAQCPPNFGHTGSLDLQRFEEFWGGLKGAGESGVVNGLRNELLSCRLFGVSLCCPTMYTLLLGQNPKTPTGTLSLNLTGDFHPPVPLCSVCCVYPACLQTLSKPLVSVLKHKSLGLNNLSFHCSVNIHS